MKRILLTLLVLSTVTTAFSTKWTVGVSGYKFSPETITIKQGDSIIFNIGSSHDAVEVSQSTWSANKNTPLNGGFATIFGGGMVLPAKLTVGTHYYVCTPHAAGGMKGTIIVQTSTALEYSETKPDFAVYSGISGGQIRVELNIKILTENSTLKFFNLQGQIINAFSGNLLSESNDYDLSALPKGIYFARFSNGNKTLISKLLIR